MRQSNQDLSITAEQRPSRHHTARNAAQSTGRAVSNSKGYLISGVLFLLLAGVTAGGYWQVTELQKTLAATRQELQKTRDQLGLVTGQVSRAGETINQSDSIFRSELKVVNAEIRKLWDVSNKRNRQWINENKEKIEQGAKQVDLTVRQVDALKKSSERVASTLSELEQGIKTVTTEQLVVYSEMIRRVEVLKAEIDGLKSDLSAQQSVKDQITNSAQTQEALGKKLSSFQNQVSLRLQQLENTVRDLGSPKDKGLKIQ